MAMPIIVKKPFSFSIDDIKSKNINDINTKDINAVNRVEQVHPEFEEKPVVESTTQTSEDVHGGSELTFSIDSSQSSGREQQQNGNTVNNQADQDTQGNTSASNNADTNNDNAADNSDNKGAQEQQNAGGEKSNDNNEVGDNAVNTDVDKQGVSNNDTQGTNNDGDSSRENVDNVNEHETTVDNDADKQSNESGGVDQDGEDGNGNNDTEDQGQESSNEGGENGSESTNIDNKSGSGEVNQDGNDGDGDGDTNDTNANQGRENDEQNSEDDGKDGESGSEDTNEQAQSGTYNTQQVVDVNAVSASSKYYQTEFWRFIEMIAEEKTRTFDPMGSEEYNVKKLMFRQFERKPLSSYKMSRVKESVVILLDNSGSMRWWSDNLQILADLAMQRNDVEVYLAPNGHIEEMLYPKRQLVNHGDVIKRLRNRKIIYVGDFDGADTPIILSWYNDVIWVCPEERYIRFLEHDWVHYDESKFKGAFLRVFTLQELFSAFKKLLSTPALRFWYDLCNVTRKCGGDEE
jgi:hypothetical protein